MRRECNLRPGGAVVTKTGRTILVTGAGGFVGSAVARRSVAWAESGGVLWDGDEATAVCALLRPGASDWRLEAVRPSPALIIERCDITDTAALQDLIGRMKPKAVLHLAFEPSGFEPQTEDEWRNRHLAPMETMFEVLSRQGDTRFVHTSSAWVLAPGEHLAEDAPVSPSLDYARAKARLDEALRALGRTYGVPFVNLRLFNVFGRYEPMDRLLPHLVSQWRSGLPAQLTHGEQLRDFNDVDDIAEAYRLALAAPSSACGAVYHIGSGRGTSVRQFAGMVRAAMDAPGEIMFDSAETRDRQIPALVSDPALAMRVLGWRPAENLEERVRAAVDWWLARPVEARDATA